MTSLPSKKKKKKQNTEYEHREENVKKFESFKSECYCGTMPKTVCNKKDSVTEEKHSKS